MTLDTGAVTRTQTEKAYAALKDGILSGDLREGNFLSEAEMMKRYAIGRTPYREACNRLHHEGLLAVVPRRGFLVPELTFQAVRELFEARRLLEGTIAELAAQRGTDEEIAKLEKLANPSPRELSDAAAIIAANSAFHLHLARMARNRELERILTHLLEASQRVMHAEVRSGFDSRQFQADHAPISLAVRKRDPKAAREATLREIGQGQTTTLTGALLGSGDRRTRRD
jgi:DNA-binding GntR family transcriptional regulator